MKPDKYYTVEDVFGGCSFKFEDQEDEGLEDENSA